MRKIFILLFLAFGFLSLNQLDNSDSTQKLTESELKFVKETYNWNSEELIIVNFRPPENRCHYNNYKNLKNSSKWWTNYYSEMELVNIYNIYVYSDNEKAKKIIDSKIHFADINSFFLNKFFSKDKTCYGILIINKDGKFKKKAGEYTKENITELINNLK